MTGVVVVSNTGCLRVEKTKESKTLQTQNHQIGRETRKEPKFKRERPEILKTQTQNLIENQTESVTTKEPNFKREIEIQSEKDKKREQISLLALLIAALRKSVVACRFDDRKDDDVAMLTGMEISWPVDVHHVAHVTFDRFNGFLGLPIEFEQEVPSRAPSASASVFGVSAESMQCGYDSKGNSVPTILLLMQEKLYAQGGLRAEGIFRINPENSQEELVRAQLNKGIVPNDIDVHCLAGLIKAWFRELPSGVLDGISPEQVLECNSEEEECMQLVRLLVPTQRNLLNWAVDLMADVVQEEDNNKMNARNIAMVFAPNMTQMSDPLTALMHAVQVMNFLKTLILKTLREREEESELTPYSPSLSRSSSNNSNTNYDSQQETKFVEGQNANNRELTSESESEIEESGEFKESKFAEDQNANSRELTSESESERSISGDYRVYYTSYMSENEEDLLNEIEGSSLKKLEFKRDKREEQNLEREKIDDVGPPIK